MSHNVTTTFDYVESCDDVDELYDIAAECDADPAEPDKCPNCLAYLTAQALEE